MLQASPSSSTPLAIRRARVPRVRVLAPRGGRGGSEGARQRGSEGARERARQGAGEGGRESGFNWLQQAGPTVCAAVSVFSSSYQSGPLQAPAAGCELVARYKGCRRPVFVPGS
jgi:hypothetical protein